MDSISPTDDDVDRALLVHLANVSAYLDICHHLENSLKTGRISLAKARCNSSCGSAEISHVSYNSAEMASYGATARVYLDDTSSFSLVDELAPFDNYMSGSTNNKLPMDHKVSDPINWFCGVLVPPQLRLAQTSFRRSLRLVTELATLRAALLKSSKELSDLIDVRTRLENEKPLISLDEESVPRSQITQ